MKHLPALLFLALAACAAGTVQAQDGSTGKPAAADELVKHEAGQEVVETRIEGRLEGVQVKPRQGPVYYFDDRAGDGTLLSGERGDLESDFNIRTWKLGEW